MPTSATAESSAAAQLLVNTMYPTASPVSNTTAVRQITPSTPIVLSAEALTALLTMNQQQQQPSQSQTSVEISSPILQYMAEQAAGQAMTLSMDSVNIPAVTELSSNSSMLEPMSNDLDVGAQEVLEEEGTGTQKQHPLHLN